MSLTQKIYNNFFNKQKTRRMQQEQKKNEVVTTSYSQDHVLQQRMKEAKLTHGQRVTADLDPIRLEQTFGKMIMYFCPMQDIHVTEVLSAGDGGSLPCEATIEGFAIPQNMKPGLYKIKNAQLYSNGRLQVIATARTEFEAV